MRNANYEILTSWLSLKSTTEYVIYRFKITVLYFEDPYWENVELMARREEVYIKSLTRAKEAERIVDTS